MNRSAAARHAPAESVAEQGEYEFTDDENRDIALCGGRARLWGGLLIGIGVLELLLGLLSLLDLVKGNGAFFFLPQGALNVVVGGAFLGGARALKSVVTTEGNDITLMLRAIREFSRAFRIQIVATIVGMALIVVGVVAMMLMVGAAISSMQ